MPVLPGPPPVEVTLRRSARARRFSLRVSRLDGRVTLTLPPCAPETEAMRFLWGHEEWLRRILGGMPVAERVSFGSILPIEGNAMTLRPGTGRGIRIEADSLIVPGEAGQVAARVAAFLKVRARDRLAAASDHYSREVGRPYSSLSLRDTRSRWGSCTADGRLMYSWRLILAPPAVLNYVAAHEVAHLAEMNHSPAYWAIVTQLYPDWRRQRQWLKTMGQTLQSYRFAA
jgi:hypothetical protein